MDTASLRDSLGLRADYEKLSRAAREHLEAWTNALGLREMQVGSRLDSVVGLSRWGLQSIVFGGSLFFVLESERIRLQDE